MNIRLVRIAYITMIVVIFVLPFFSAEGYSIIRHTTSQLGAQKTKLSWIMNIVFILLGSACIISGFFILLPKFPLPYVLLATFGLSLIMTAIFSHAPIDESLAFNVTHDKYHSLFASMTGFAFVLFAISSMFTHENLMHKYIGFGIAMSALLLSFLILNLPESKGIWQRLMFISSFIWIDIYLTFISNNT